MWVAGLDDLFGRVAGRFFRAEPRLRARAYVRSLLAPLAGKNGWTLAEAAGDQAPDGMQRLLNRRRRTSRGCVMMFARMPSSTSVPRTAC